MKDAYELLEQKEADLARVRHEIESLRIVSPLLSDEVTSEDPHKKRESSGEKAQGPELDSKATGTDGIFSSSPESRPKFWNVLKREK